MYLSILPDQSLRSSPTASLYLTFFFFRGVAFGPGVGTPEVPHVQMHGLQWINHLFHLLAWHTTPSVPNLLSLEQQIYNSFLKKSTTLILTTTISDEVNQSHFLKN
jgi:hypothetical protein